MRKVFNVVLCLFWLILLGPLVKAQEGGTYQIINAYNGKLLTMAPGDSDGAELSAWDSNGQDNQRWKLFAEGNGTFKIVNASNGKLLDMALIQGDPDGATVYGWHNNGQSNQRWRLVKEQNGQYQIVNAFNGKLLDMALIQGNPNGAKVYAFHNNGQSNQRWRLVSLTNNSKPNPAVSIVDDWEQRFPLRASSDDDDMYGRGHYFFSGAQLSKEGYVSLESQARTANASGMVGVSQVEFYDQAGNLVYWSGRNRVVVCGTIDPTCPSNRKKVIRERVPSAILLKTYSIQIKHYSGSGGYDIPERLNRAIKAGEDLRDAVVEFCKRHTDACFQAAAGAQE